MDMDFIYRLEAFGFVLMMKCAILEQQITTKDRFLLLDSSDLRELGFLMGPRKQLEQWIQNCGETASNSSILLTPSSSIPVSQSSPVTPSTSTSSTTRRTHTPTASHIGRFQVSFWQINLAVMFAWSSLL